MSIISIPSHPFTLHSPHHPSTIITVSCYLTPLPPQPHPITFFQSNHIPVNSHFCHRTTFLPSQQPPIISPGTSHYLFHVVSHPFRHIDGLVQKWRNSSALAMELYIFSIKPSISPSAYHTTFPCITLWSWSVCHPSLWSVLSCWYCWFFVSKQFYYHKYQCCCFDFFFVTALPLLLLTSSAIASWIITYGAVTAFKAMYSIRNLSHICCV